MQEHPSNEKSVIRPVAMALAVAGLISVSGAAMAQDAKAAAPAASGASAPAAPKDYKDYKEVTKDFKAVDGLFKTHFDAKKNQVMFEIPKALLGEPLLMVQNITAVPPKVDHVGKMANQDVIRTIDKALYAEGHLAILKGNLIKAELRHEHLGVCLQGIPSAHGASIPRRLG